MGQFGADTGDWSYNAGSTMSGTWVSDYTGAQGLWDTSADDLTRSTRITYTSTTDDQSTD